MLAKNTLASRNTHDERYLERLNLLARKIRMDEGRIIEQRLITRG